ncbi:MAG TPA: DUF805 domain-containing protein [Brevundimonas sp.]|uniref:DUF805 domain-containing protein n=1 Tax=Brevundimonas sp. TaxID=1871086 RepID=UPI002E110CE8|nr:DUF805 domain-containing protein [Brevundimonas sp.]
MITVHHLRDTLLTGDGRIGRLPFLLGIGGLAGLSLVVDLLPDDGAVGLVATGLRLPLLFSLACLLSQRLHDIGRAGWWLWPVLGGLFALNALSDGEATAGAALLVVGVLGLWPGQAVFNRYGAPPAGPLSATGPKTS